MQRLIFRSFCRDLTLRRSPKILKPFGRTPITTRVLAAFPICAMRSLRCRFSNFKTWRRRCIVTPKRVAAIGLGTAAARPRKRLAFCISRSPRTPFLSQFSQTGKTRFAGSRSITTQRSSKRSIACVVAEATEISRNPSKLHESDRLELHRTHYRTAFFTCLDYGFSC